MTQGQALRALNESVGPRDWLIVSSGTPHVDVHKLWDPERGERCLMEVGFSCMARRDPRRDSACGWRGRTRTRSTRSSATAPT